MDAVAASAQGSDPSYHVGHPEGSTILPRALPYGPVHRAHERSGRLLGRDHLCDPGSDPQGPDAGRSASFQPSSRSRPISPSSSAPAVAGRNAHAAPLRRRVFRVDPHGRPGASGLLDSPVRVEDAPVRIAPRKSRAKRADGPEPHRCAGGAGPDRITPYGSAPSPRALRRHPRGDASTRRPGRYAFHRCAAPVPRAGGGGRAPGARASCATIH